jgi:hypothetical protein
MVYKQDKKCMYNVTFEACSDILNVKLMNGMAIASLPWQSQYTVISRLGDSKILSKMYLYIHVKCPLLSDFN